MKSTVKFESEGLVYGNYWGGGKGAYSARKLKADTLEELLKQANEGLDDGSLDRGMGYESLIGALLLVKTITTVIIKGKEFNNEETEEMFIGNLTEQEQNFLIENIMYT